MKTITANSFVPPPEDSQNGKGFEIKTYPGSPATHEFRVAQFEPNFDTNTVFRLKIEGVLSDHEHSDERLLGLQKRLLKANEDMRDDVVKIEQDLNEQGISDPVVCVKADDSCALIVGEEEKATVTIDVQSVALKDSFEQLLAKVGK